MGKKKISWIPIAIFFFTADELAGVNLMSSPGPIWILSGSHLGSFWDLWMPPSIHLGQRCWIYSSHRKTWSTKKTGHYPGSSPAWDL